MFTTNVAFSIESSIRPPASTADRTIAIDHSIVKKKYNLTYKQKYFKFNSKQKEKIKLSDVKHVLVLCYFMDLGVRP